MVELIFHLNEIISDYDLALLVLAFGLVTGCNYLATYREDKNIIFKCNNKQALIDFADYLQNLGWNLNKEIR